ncbi:MAG: LysR family transcriptional regulator [Steroidobacteraceae bacterium]
MATIPRVNYQHLMYFWSVVRNGSLTRACEELALSAPAVSAQLRTFEERLGEKLLTRSGRRLVPTETGKLVFGYAEEIFTLGREMLDALEQRPSTRPLRLLAGIDDVVAKEIAYRLIEPGLRIGRPVRVVCREGTLERLVAQLVVHELDVVLSDAPVTPSLNVRVHSHPLGHCKVYWMATPALARKLRRGFPASLEGVPVLLPTDDTAIRRSLDEWFERRGVRPLLLGEFEDYAMLREFANAGHGFAPVPAILERQFRKQYGLARVGTAVGVRSEFYAISSESKIRHPAIAAMMQSARQLLTAE